MADIRIIALHGIDKSAPHFAAVLAAMQRLGPPSIRAVALDAGLYQALEGSHRLAAAAALGLPIVLDEVAFCDSADADIGAWSGIEDATSVAAVLAWADRNHNRPTYAVGDDGIIAV